MRFPAILLFTILLLYSQKVISQYYDTGQDPASLKWMQIKTSHFTVIYPVKYGSEGIKYAKSLDKAYSKLIALFPEKKFRIPVIIHNYTTQSNGYVAWAPHRMELYPTPEQNTIPLSSVDQLTIHELTHVFQMESLDKGFSKGISMLLGQQFSGIISSMLPLWLLEGDAVFAESALSESGRGRSPSFQKELKAISIEKPSLFKYDKILNGSYKDFLPDHYRYGYQIVTWAQLKYGFGIWNKAFDFTANQPFTINPVNITLLRNAGMTKKRLYEEAFDSLKTIWSKEMSNNNPVTYTTLNPSKRGKYINYYSPVVAGNDSIMAIKTSLSELPEFVLINTAEKTETNLHIPGQLYPWVISFGGGKLVWVENLPDPRWENREFSVIKLLDIKSGSTFKLSKRSRYLSAAISPDGRKISATENTIDNINNLVLIDARSGSVIQKINTPGNVYLQHPEWTGDGEKITFIFLSETGEGVMTFNIADQKWETLIDAGRDDLQSAVLRNDSLFFISSASGNDNVFLRTRDGKRTLLTLSNFGVTDLFLKGGSVYFSDYSSLGNNICSTSLGTASGLPPENSNFSSFLINRINLKASPDNIQSGNDYTPTPYKKWQHLFNVHSWMPFYADLEQIKSDPASVRPGVTLMSQNQLSTLITSVGYEYSAGKHNVFHSRIIWKGWYPVFESRFDYGNDPLIDKMGQNVANPSGIYRGRVFSNTISLPFTFSSGRFSQYLNTSLTSDFKNEYVFLKEENTYDYGQTLLSSRVYFSNYQGTALRDIYPKWAQIFDFTYAWAPLDKSLYGTETTVRSSFYFPGILPNNGIKIRIQKEKQNPSRFLYGNKVDFPRGYKNIYSKELEFLSIDYTMPVGYPDFNIWSLLYLKRIRATLFYDYGSGTGNYYFKNSASGLVFDSFHNYNELFRSFGFELMTDFHVFRIPFMISGGIQAAWKNLSSTPTVGLLFNIDLFGMSVGKNPK